MIGKTMRTRRRRLVGTSGHNATDTTATLLHTGHSHD